MKLQKLIVRGICASLILMCSCPLAYAVTVPRSVQADTVGKQAEPVQQPAPPPAIEVPATMPVHAPKGAEKVYFTLKHVVIAGSTVYTPKQLKEYYQSLLGKKVSLADVYAIAAHITQRYFDDGYVISKALLPPQKITGGVVHIRVIEGYISHIRWQGDQLNSRIAHDMADKLLAMRPLRGPDLESIMLLLNDLPGVQAKATIAPGKEEGAVDIVLKIERKRVDASLDLNDYASRYLGVWQSSVQADINGVISSIDNLSFNVLSSVDTAYSRYERAVYSIPVSSSGMSVFAGGSKSHSAPGYKLENLQIRSDADYAWFGLSQPVLRSRRQSLTLSAQFNIHNLKTDILSSPFYEDRIRTLQLSATYNLADQWNGSNLIQADLFKGLNILNATPVGSAKLSRSIGDSNFLKLALTASRLQVLNDRFSLLASVTGQLTNAPLLSSEQFGYGGMPFGRGYDASEISGDEGMAGSLELRYNTAISPQVSLKPYVFYDIGKIWNRGVPGDALSGASAGIGTRCMLSTYAQMDISLAKPLTLPTTTPKLGAVNNDPRINLSFKLYY